MAIAIILSSGRTWKTKAAALSHFKAMLARYADGKVVEDRNDHFTRTRNNFNGYSTQSF